MASFRKNGWDIEPITVNKDYVIISGHHRLAAAVQAEVDIKSDDFEFIKVDEKLQSTYWRFSHYIYRPI